MDRDSLALLLHGSSVTCRLWGALLKLANLWLQMQHAYDEYNERARATGKSRGHFMVDLCSPGHMTACLRNFQEATRCTDDTWESSFGESQEAREYLQRHMM